MYIPQSGLCVATLLLLAAGAAEPEAEELRGGSGGGERDLRLEAIAGGAGEDGSAACLLQREGRALAPARGPAASPAAVEPGQSASAASRGQEAALLQEALLPKPPLSVSLASGVSSGMGIGGDQPPAAMAQSGEAEGKQQKPANKDKVLLLVIEMFPPAWLLGLDRFYLGSFRSGVAKLLLSGMTLGFAWGSSGAAQLLLSAITLSVGGLVWGLIDFFIVIVNGFQRAEALRSLGMEADFKPSMQQSAFVLAIVDLCLLPVWAGVARYVWWVRKMQRMERLKENAMKSPHFVAKAPATTIRGG